MTKESSRGARLERVLKEKKISQQRCAEAMGLKSRQAVSRMILGKVDVSDRNIKALCVEYIDINIEYLLSCRGEPLTDSPEVELKTVYTEVVSQKKDTLSNTKNSNLYQERKLGTSSIPFFTDMNEMIIPDRSWDIPDWPDAEAITAIQGHSMDKIIDPGAPVALKKVDPEDWRNGILDFGKPHLIKTKSLSIFRIVKQSENTDFLRLETYSTIQSQDDDFEIAKRYIKEIHAVLRWINGW